MRTFLLLLASASLCSAQCIGKCFEYCNVTAKAYCDLVDWCAGYQLEFYPNPADPILYDYAATFTNFSDQCHDVTTKGSVADFYYFRNSSNSMEYEGGQSLKPRCKTYARRVCPQSPTVENNCPSRPAPEGRKTYLWLPGWDTAKGEEILQGFRLFPGAYTHLSYTIAFWEVSTFNCSDPMFGICDANVSSNMPPQIDEAVALGVRLEPIIEVCCQCVLADGYDYEASIAYLTQMAVAGGYDGVFLDIVCGNVDQAKRAALFDTFSRYFHPLNLTVSWWTHYEYLPALSFPNAADWVFSMDTYHDTTPSFAQHWMKLFSCQGGIGLEWGGASTPAVQTQEMFDYLINDKTSQVLGTWGNIPVTTEGASWFRSFQVYVAAWDRLNGQQSVVNSSLSIAVEASSGSVEKTG